uniref:t-SNARE coiled-coil homology domain-containing protein n=1 Tax=Spongospora subterranea TaxID=70186 RepID=A0A0H5R714_9EUKA|eukprot:CRZ09621.1 hypothetical protein [Spongospora subterranea]
MIPSLTGPLTPLQDPRHVLGSRGAFDRTSEFFSTADSFRRQGTGSQFAESIVAPMPITAVNFNKAAMELSQMISNTKTKLENLEKIAQARTLFNDPSEQIAQLTTIIKADINSISQEVDILAKYGAEHQTGLKQVDGHTNGVVKDLKTKVADQTKMFQSILKIRSANMRTQDTRRGQYSAVSSASPAQFGMRQRPVAVSYQEMASSQSSSYQTPAQMNQEQTQSLLHAPQRGADIYLESRATAITEIDSTIQELGEMYQRLATIVSMQGEQISRIDDNVVLTLGNVEGAHEQLVMYWDRMRSNRSLIIKVFLALIVFAVLFLGVIA